MSGSSSQNEFNDWLKQSNLPRGTTEGGDHLSNEGILNQVDFFLFLLLIFRIETNGTGRDKKEKGEKCQASAKQRKRYSSFQKGILIILLIVEIFSNRRKCRG